MVWNGPLNKIDDFRYEIPSNYKGEKNSLKMRTSAVIYANPHMIDSIRKDNAPEQAANVTMLPGIVGKSLAMPDIHWGYGFPIGGVAATDAEEGVLSPGGVGFDINCISIFQTEAYLIIYTIVVFQILEVFTLHAFQSILHAKQPQKIGYGFLIFEACRVLMGYILIIQLDLNLLGAIASVIIAYILQLIFYLKLTAHELQEKIRWGYLAEWLKASPINLYSITGQRLAAFALILLFIFAGEVARAYYGAALTIATIIGYSSLLAFALYPKLLSKIDARDISTSLRMVVMFAIPMTVGAVIMSDSYVTILKSEFHLAESVLVVLAIDALFTSVSAVFGNIISGTEKVDEKAKIPFRELIKTRLFLVYTFPYIKAAISIPLTYFILTTSAQTAIEATTTVATIILVTDVPILFGTYIIARKCLDFSMPWKSIAKYVVASGVMAAVLFIIPHPTRILYTIAVTLLGGGIYLLILLLTDKEARSLARSITQELPKIMRLSR